MDKETLDMLVELRKKSDKEVLMKLMEHCEELDNPEGLPCEITCAECAANEMIRLGFHRDSEIDIVKRIVRCGDCKFYHAAAYTCDNNDGCYHNHNLGKYDGCTQGIDIRNKEGN